MESVYYVVLYVIFDWLTKMMFSHIKISYFLPVFKYIFSQWPKTLSLMFIKQNIFLVRRRR